MDQVTKRFFSENISVVGGMFSITPIVNPGSAFGLFSGKIGFLVLVSVIVIGLLVYMLKDSKKEMYIVFAVFFAGLFGNLIDRVFFGGVFDFLDFIIWPVFNLADTYLCVAVFLMVVDWIVEKKSISFS